jgi:hypothetical protein
MTEEEDQYMDWTVGGADEPEAAAPMAARSRCRRSTAGMRRRWHRNRNRSGSKIFPWRLNDSVDRALNFPRLCPPRNSSLCSIRAHCLRVQREDQELVQIRARRDEPF